MQEPAQPEGGLMHKISDPPILVHRRPRRPCRLLQYIGDHIPAVDVEPVKKQVPPPHHPAKIEEDCSQ